jgi:hypothetical protein
VAIWTEINFFPLLTCSQGSQRCQIICQHPLNSNLEVWCAKIEAKLNNLQKIIKIEKKSSKTMFSYSFLKIVQFWLNLSAPNLQMFNGCWRIIRHSWDPWGRINSGKKFKSFKIFFDFLWQWHHPSGFFSLLWKCCPMSTL